jgi:dihydrolipoamide dehydrogenase
VLVDVTGRFWRKRYVFKDDTEAQAAWLWVGLVLRGWWLGGTGKAIALGEPAGMVKTVFDAETGELLRAHMVGAEVTEFSPGGQDR